MARPRPSRHPAADCGGPVDWAAVRRILAVRVDNLGDVITVTPALRALRAAAPQAGLHLMASPVGGAVAELVPEVDDVLVVRPIWQDAAGSGRHDPAADAELVRRLRGGRYDVMVAFTSFSQSPWPVAYLAHLAGIPVRAGHSREFGGALLSHWVTPPPDGTHVVDRSVHLVRALGAPPPAGGPSLTVPASARRSVHARLAAVTTSAGPGAPVERGTPYVVLAPGASCPARRYPPDRFAAVARGLAGAGLRVVVVGTEREAGLVADVVGTAGAGTTALTGGTVAELAALVEGAAVAVTNNSGGLHVADAVGTPVVVAFSGTERAAELVPRGVPSVFASQPVSCSPCRQFACPYELECLDVAPDVLVDAALRLAGHPADPARAADGARPADPARAADGARPARATTTCRQELSCSV